MSWYFLELLFSGKWNEYLHSVDEECYERMSMLVEQMKVGAGITEELKASDQMKWVVLLIMCGVLRRKLWLGKWSVYV